MARTKKTTAEAGSTIKPELNDEEVMGLMQERARTATGASKQHDIYRQKVKSAAKVSSLDDQALAFVYKLFKLQEAGDDERASVLLLRVQRYATAIGIDTDTPLERLIAQATPGEDPAMLGGAPAGHA